MVYAVALCQSFYHKSVFYTKVAKYRIMETMPYDRSGTLVMPKMLMKFKGRLKLVIFDQYLRKGARYGHCH